TSSRPRRMRFSAGAARWTGAGPSECLNDRETSILDPDMTETTHPAAPARPWYAKLFRASGPVIPVVRLQGVIASSPRPGRLNIAGVAPLLGKAFAFKRAPVVALIVNSPGGSPVQSRLIAEHIRHLADRHGKKVLVFVEDAAASGGYFIAVAGDEIIADPSSIVGSVGVVYSGFGFVEAIAKLGIT